MKQAKLFSLIVFVITACYGAVGFYALPLASYEGDLTRVGMLPESKFGWTKPQPAIDPSLIQQSSWQDADVLVVGDSFSDGRIWQTALTQHGLKVRTESWDSMRAICEDFMPWVRTQGFKGKHIVFESIERNLVEGVGKSLACKHMQFHPSVYADSPRGAPAVFFDRNRRDYVGRLSIGLQTLLNDWQYEQLRGAADFNTLELGNSARLARVKNGCTLFSHLRCQDALFFAEDKAEDIPNSTLDDIEKLNARLPGIQPIWVFVPNKSTVYLYPDKQFWNAAENRLGAPNILLSFRQALAAKTVDLYPANNTHVLTTGYLILGEAIYHNLKHSR